VRIDRCICTGRTFDDLLAEARSRGWSLPQLAEHTGATRGCGLCGPYLRRACRTGELTFDRILTDADEPGAAG